MINLSYGSLERKYLDEDLIKKTVINGLGVIDFSRYSRPGGSQALREAIAEKYLDGCSYDHCCVSVSTNLSFSIIADKHRKGKIAIFSPFYLNYKSQIELLSGRDIVKYEYSDLYDSCLDFSELGKGDIAVIVLPDNPTGRVMTIQSLEENLKKLYRKGVVAVIDGSWVETIFASNKILTLGELALLALRYDSFLLFGFTKVFGMAGIRCSAVVAGSGAINEFVQRHDNLVVGCGAVDEFVVTSFLKNGISPVDWQGVRNSLGVKSEYIKSLLMKSGIVDRVISPDAGIFLYLYLRDCNTDKLQELCRERGLLFYPSSLFENNHQGLRLCYFKSNRDIDMGIEILIDSYGDVKI